jgi:hypothetical protein
VLGCKGGFSAIGPENASILLGHLADRKKPRLCPVSGHFGNGAESLFKRLINGVSEAGSFSYWVDITWPVSSRASGESSAFTRKKPRRAFLVGSLGGMICIASRRRRRGR